MPEEQYHKRRIATEQLKTAIWLFLNGRDRASVITLAGAASAILYQIMKNESKTPFIDFARNVLPAFGVPLLPRARYNRYVNDRIGINPLKHMSSDCPDTLEIDLEQNAEYAIAKAIADYIPLFGEEQDFIKAYLQWAWINRDGPQIMKDYAELPRKLRRQ